MHSRACSNLNFKLSLSFGPKTISEQTIKIGNGVLSVVYLCYLRFRLLVS